MLERIRDVVGAARRRWRPTTEVGLSVAPGELVAVSVQRGVTGPSPDRVFRRPLEAGPGEGDWPALASALRELRSRLEVDDDDAVRAHAALLPPLGRAKVVRLPAARREALRRLATREAHRHFLPAPRKPVGDGFPLERRRDGPVRALVTCAEEPVVDAILAALEASDIEAGLATPAAWSVAEGVRALAPGRGARETTLEVRGVDWRQDLRLEDGDLVAVAAAPAGVHGDAPPAGPGAVEDGAGSGPRLRLDGSGDGLQGLGPEAVAAFGALVQPEDGPLLLHGEARDRWRRRGRLRAGALSAAAVGLLAVAGLVHLRGLDRELRAVARARAAIADPVAEASTARDAAERMGDLLASLRDLRPAGASWPEVVAELARRLPRSAYLDRLSSTDRGLVLSGSARSPSSLVPLLEDSPLLEGVTLESVSRGDGQGPDAFQIVLRLSRRGAEDGAGAAGDAARSDTAPPGAASSAADGAPGERP